MQPNLSYSKITINSNFLVFSLFFTFYLIAIEYEILLQLILLATQFEKQEKWNGMSSQLGKGDASKSLSCENEWVFFFSKFFSLKFMRSKKKRLEVLICGYFVLS